MELAMGKLMTVFPRHGEKYGRCLGVTRTVSSIGVAELALTFYPVTGGTPSNIVDIVLQ